MTGYRRPPQPKGLGRGSRPKRGTPGKNRSIRMPDEIWDRFVKAAERKGISVADFLIDAGERRLAR